MDINKKLKEVETIYQEKIKKLNKARQDVNTLTTECVNLEGQIKILKEINEDTN